MVRRIIVTDLSAASNSTSIGSDLPLGQGISVDMDIDNSSDDETLAASIHMSTAKKVISTSATTTNNADNETDSNADDNANDDAGNAISADITDNDMRLYSADAANIAAKSSVIACPESNVTDFAKNRLHHWPQLANIPTKLVLRPGDAVVDNKTYFRYSFATDGVGISLYTHTWKSCPNAAKNLEPVKQKATRLANAAVEAATAATNRQWTLDNFDRAFLGIDPGRLATLTAKRLGDPD
ncbi:hypothetical protein IW152_005429 [Coemansia sp. BCRC 34962]|nr:hypothetical protein IW152_005429 [Coemansia sp. BCRC 34962]